jgi:glutamate racemase
MQIIDPSQAVAAQTRRVLEENKMLSDSGHPRLSFYTTGTKNTLENILSAILDLQYDLKGISP